MIKSEKTVFVLSFFVFNILLGVISQKIKLLVYKSGEKSIFLQFFIVFLIFVIENYFFIA